MASIQQITAQLDAVLASAPHATVVAVHSNGRQNWPASIERRQRSFALRWCESGLAMREALMQAEANAASQADGGLLLLTPLSDRDVPADVAARLARARVFEPGGWDVVRQLWGAQAVDARLGRLAWMPQVLIDLSDQGPFVPVPSGFLDLDTAWGEVLRRGLGLDAARPDGRAVLDWSQRPDADAQLARLPAKARADLQVWLADAAGAAGGLTMRCAAAGRTADALALALVCDVVFSPNGEGEAALGQAAVRLERFAGDQHVSLAEGRDLASHARRLLDRQSPGEARGALDRADALLRELRVVDFAFLSDHLPHGFELRLKALAAALMRLAAASTAANAALVEEATNSALQHRLAGAHPLRAERVEMARRIGRWLMQPGESAKTLEALLSWQADQGAWLDWARFRLLGGDELPELSQAYARLRSEVLRLRTKLTESFPAVLKQSNQEAPPRSGRIVPVEAVLDRVLAPLAAAHPVLLLVVDGLSLAIFRELFEQPAKFGWSELIPEELERPLVGMAALPTITEVSRSSLLSGRLVSGAAPKEKAAFSSHPALLQASNASAPPLLFHKGQLADESGLTSDVRDALANPRQRVVGIVYNAVDDHLSGPQQLHHRWSLDGLRLLLPMLREALAARRVLVVTADHGHVLEDGTSLLPGGEHDRWRLGTQVHHQAEMALAGGRVVTAGGANEAVLLSTESHRYASRKNGYHGGATLQEVAVPLGVFAPFAIDAPGFRAAPPQQPEWWELPHAAVSAAAKIAVSVKPPVRKPATAKVASGGLFSADELPVPVPDRSVSGAAEPGWIAALLTSTVYASQRRLAARVALEDGAMRKLLESLHERGGTLTRAALAQRLGVPEMRLPGLLSAARRVLNVDQAAVLSVDESAGSIRLNHHLLMQQFRLPAAVGHR